jgi:hypothetical protein
VFGYVVFAGFAVAYVTAILTISYAIIAAAAFVLSWLLDSIPPFRRRGVGASIRRACRSPPKDPS